MMAYAACAAKEMQWKTGKQAQASAIGMCSAILAAYRYHAYQGASMRFDGTPPDQACFHQPAQDARKAIGSIEQ